MTREQIEALLAGLDGVTPGPWTAERSHPADSADCWWIKAPWSHPCIERFYKTLAYVDHDSDADSTSTQDAAHIARCDPDTIRELCRLALIGLSQQWQPIETAPKDGRPVLVGRHGYCPQVWCWHQEIIGEGWPWLVALPGEDAMRLKPTHWMPLTAPEKKI